MRNVTSTDLRDMMLRGEPFRFDPYRGTDLSKDSPRPFKAAELGLEPFRYWQTNGDTSDAQWVDCALLTARRNIVLPFRTLDIRTNK